MDGTESGTLILTVEGFNKCATHLNITISCTHCYLSVIYSTIDILIILIAMTNIQRFKKVVIYHPLIEQI